MLSREIESKEAEAWHGSKNNAYGPISLQPKQLEIQKMGFFEKSLKKQDKIK